MSNNGLSLYEFNQKIKNGLEGLFPFPAWVVAEISELSARQHCYLELVQKDETSDKIVAKARATIWSYTYNMLKPYFETTTGYELAAGLKVLLNVEVQFNELYGLSLNVKDIDPNYTLGDLQQRRQSILKRLEEEGILEMNKALDFPTLPKRIALVSSEKAAGYQDFTEQLQANGQGYHFHTQLFPALMQGAQAAASIMQALERIYDYEEVFDAVVIIRGGGAVSDLSCFDDYELAAHVAQFPLPILTGIGHDKDRSIVDEVAYRSLKTPTAVAAFLLACFDNCEMQIHEVSNIFSSLVKAHLAQEQQQLFAHTNLLHYKMPALFREHKLKLKGVAKDLSYLTLEKLSRVKNKEQKTMQHLDFAIAQQRGENLEKLLYLQRKLKHRTRQFLANQKESLLHKEQVGELLSPQKLLEKGYSITTRNGKVVKDATTIAVGDTVETQLAQGKLTATVK